MITCWQTVEQVVILFRIPGSFPVFNNLNVSLFEVFLYALKKVVFVPCLECIRVFFRCQAVSTAQSAAQGRLDITVLVDWA